MTDRKDIPPCMIFIDRDGKWFHKGAEMIHRGIILDFYRALSTDSYGNYIISLGNERCYVEAEDTPFVVTRAIFAQEEGTGLESISLFICDDTVEKLDPASLRIGEKNILYCTIRKGAFTARFSRAAYYQIAGYIKEEGDKYYLPLNDLKFYLDISLS